MRGKEAALRFSAPLPHSAHVPHNSGLQHHVCGVAKKQPTAEGERRKEEEERKKEERERRKSTDKSKDQIRNLFLLPLSFSTQRSTAPAAALPPTDTAYMRCISVVRACSRRRRAQRPKVVPSSAPLFFVLPRPFLAHLARAAVCIAEWLICGRSAAATAENERERTAADGSFLLTC